MVAKHLSARTPKIEGDIQTFRMYASRDFLIKVFYRFPYVRWTKLKVMSDRVIEASLCVLILVARRRRMEDLFLSILSVATLCGIGKPPVLKVRPVSA